MKEVIPSTGSTESPACCDSTGSSICCDPVDVSVSHEIPICCDMRGLLSFQILWLLSKEPMYGQKIADELFKRRGFKPSPGTIYPALKDLEQRGYIKSDKQGRRKTYRLIEEKRADVDQACRYFCHVFFDIFEEYMGKVSSTSVKNPI